MARSQPLIELTENKSIVKSQNHSFHPVSLIEENLRRRKNKKKKERKDR
jgi:hypothetical protein